MSELPKRAHRLDRLPPYEFAVIGQRIQEMIAAGKDVIRLDIGSPDMPPPGPVIEALQMSASDPKRHSYGSYRGDPAFRRAVANYYARRFGVTLDPDQEVLPLIGSKEGLVNLSMAYLDRGDAALVPDISYPAYHMGALLAGADVIDMPLDPARGYLPDWNAIKPSDLSRAKLLWVNYPNNPTGSIADLAFYEKAVAFCKAHNLLLASDNPYCEVAFDGYHAPSALQATDAKDCTVEFISMSKTFNMAGWRLGACVGNRDVIGNLLTVKSNIDSGHFRPIFDAGVVAFETTPDTWLEQRNQRYQQRRDWILEVLPEIGLEASSSPASLYVWARVKGGDSRRYCEHALSEAMVALTPGEVYGPGGRGYVRISLSVGEDRLEQALVRLHDWHRVKV
jgi:LL-diaminopimelate aminotransferase